MFWEESKKDSIDIVPGDIVDLAFGISCRTLPVDHAYSLSEALLQVLPWLETEKHAAMHAIHVAASANGWMRPDNPNDLLHLSRRTKLIVRVPRHRIEDTKQLLGQTLVVAGNELLVKNVSEKPLSLLTTIFSRYIVTDKDSSEVDFLMHIKEQLDHQNIKPKKMLCGTQTCIQMPQGELHTRSLMLAELETDESIALQQNGLGQHQHMGCGIFIPHKDIKHLAED